MTPPSPELLRTRSYFPWLMLLVGLVVGFFIGRLTISDAQARLGNCVSTDSTVFDTGVSQTECKADCPTCSWTQAR